MSKQKFLQAIKDNDIETLESIQDIDIHMNYELFLRTAMDFKQLDIVKYLVGKRGANIHRWIEHPLYFSIITEQFELLKYLINQGADIHIRNDYFFKIVEELGNQTIVEYFKGI